MSVSLFNIVDCLNYMLGFIGKPADLYSVSGVCKLFKELANKPPVWQQKAFKWGAADWSSLPEGIKDWSKLPQEYYKQQAVLFVVKYNYFMVNEILFKLAPDVTIKESGNIFTDKKAIDAACKSILPETRQQHLEAAARIMFIRKSQEEETRLDFNQTRSFYILLEAGVKLDKSFISHFVNYQAPSALIKAICKDDYDSVHPSLFRRHIISFEQACEYNKWEDDSSESETILSNGEEYTDSEEILSNTESGWEVDEFGFP